ncbi:MAG: hypothetical protein WCZ89_06810 [Phycisphaerae bacterium]
MAVTRKIHALHFDDKNDPRLLAKINAVAPYLYRTSVHDLVRYVLDSFCDKQILEHNITVDYSKPTQSAGAG